jgi:hypothetical protein
VPSTHARAHDIEAVCAGLLKSEVVCRYRLMDEEDCEEFTDVYWLKFSSISNAR